MRTKSEIEILEEGLGLGDDVRFVKFSQQKKQKIEGYLRSVAAMGADYVWIEDLDRSPTIRATAP